MAVDMALASLYIDPSWTLNENMSTISVQTELCSSCDYQLVAIVVSGGIADCMTGIEPHGHTSLNFASSKYFVPLIYPSIYSHKNDYYCLPTHQQNQYHKHNNPNQEKYHTANSQRTPIPQLPNFSKSSTTTNNRRSPFCSWRTTLNRSNQLLWRSRRAGRVLQSQTQGGHCLSHYCGSSTGLLEGSGYVRYVYGWGVWDQRDLRRWLLFITLVNSPSGLVLWGVRVFYLRLGMDRLRLTDLHERPDSRGHQKTESGTENRRYYWHWNRRCWD